MIVSGTSTETIVNVKPSAPPAATASATAVPSASTIAASARTERNKNTAITTSKRPNTGNARADASAVARSIHELTYG